MIAGLNSRNMNPEKKKVVIYTPRANASKFCVSIIDEKPNLCINEKIRLIAEGILSTYKS